MRKESRWSRYAAMIPLAVMFMATGAFAEEEAVSLEMFTVNNLWMMIAAALVFLMHLGFATLESGLTRSKNTVNVLFKNVFIISIGIITYALVGFNLMYPGFAEGSMGIFGFAGFGIAADAAAVTAEYSEGYTYWTDFLFQAMFAATCVTIVSGAVAERIKLASFMVFATIYVAFVYPVLGSWQWGEGWLDAMGFYDFAGSSIVHSVGGWAALAGAIMVGARRGKYVDGKIRPIPGHSLALATIGVFLLWLGWFGFNGGSVLTADAADVSLTLVNTALAAAAGAIAAMFTSWATAKKPDLTMALNGVLGGLVGITAGADLMGMTSSIVIGLIAGVIVVFSVYFFDRVKIDDPVGAISVHLTCGIWGTLAVGLFGDMAGMGQLGYQIVGIIAYGLGAFIPALIIFAAVKAVMGLRVSAEEEEEGLDIGEHGMSAYPDFQSTTHA